MKTQFGHPSFHPSTITKAQFGSPTSNQMNFIIQLLGKYNQVLQLVININFILKLLGHSIWSSRYKLTSISSFKY